MTRWALQQGVGKNVDSEHSSHPFTKPPMGSSAPSEPASSFLSIQEMAERVQLDPGPIRLIPSRGRYPTYLALWLLPSLLLEQPWSRPTVATRGNPELCPQEAPDRQAVVLTCCPSFPRLTLRVAHLLGMTLHTEAHSPPALVLLPMLIHR